MTSPNERLLHTGTQLNFFLRFTVEHFLLQPSSSCHFSCTWAHLRPDGYRANSFNDKELSQPGVESTGSRWQLEVEQTAYGIELLCQGQWLDRNLQELCWHLEEFHITHQHTRWRGQDILTQSTPTAVVQDHYGFSLLWLCSMKRTYDRGLSIAFAILKYLTEHSHTWLRPPTGCGGFVLVTAMNEMSLHFFSHLIFKGVHPYK